MLPGKGAWALSHIERSCQYSQVKAPTEPRGRCIVQSCPAVHVLVVIRTGDNAAEDIPEDVALELSAENVFNEDHGRCKTHAIRHHTWWFCRTSPMQPHLFGVASLTVHPISFDRGLG